MNAIKRIAKNTGVMLIGNNALKIISILLVFFIARYLGDAEYGKFSFVLSFTGLFFIFMDLGTRILIVREIAQNKKKAPKIVSNVLLLKVFTSFIVYLIIIAVAVILKYENDLIFAIGLAAIGIVFDSLSVTIESIFQSYERMEYPTTIKIVRIILRFAITIPLLMNGFGFIHVLIAFVAVQFLNFIISIIICFRLLVKPIYNFDRNYNFSLVKKAFPFLLSGIFATVYFRIDITLMSKIAPEMLSGFYSQTSKNAIIGWYSAAYNIIDGLISIPLAVSIAALPVAIIYFKESKEKLIKLYTLTVKYLTYISIPSAVGITLLADKIIVLIYKETYVNATLALQILVWTIIPLFINYILGIINIAVHKEREGVYVLFGNCIVNLALNIILIPKYSLYGAAAATVISEIFYFIGYYYIISKSVFSLNIFKFMIKPIISSVMMGIIIHYFLSINVFLLVILGAGIYFLFMYWMKAFSEEDFAMINKILKKN